MNKQHMVKFWMLSFFLGSSLTASPAPGKEAPWKDIPQSDVITLFAAVQKTPQLAVDFKQKTFKKLRKRWVENSGSALFQRPRLFRWAFTKPESEEWIFDGKTLFHYFPKKNVAQKHSVEDDMSKELSTLVDMVLSYDALSKNFSMKSAKRNEKQLVVTFAPLKKGFIEGLETTVDLSKNVLESVEIKSENSTRFEFFHPSVAPVDPKRFELASSVKLITLK